MQGKKGLHGLNKISMNILFKIIKNSNFFCIFMQILFQKLSENPMKVMIKCYCRVLAVSLCYSWVHKAFFVLFTRLCGIDDERKKIVLMFYIIEKFDYFIFFFTLENIIKKWMWNNEVQSFYYVRITPKPPLYRLVLAWMDHIQNAMKHFLSSVAKW